MYGSSKSEDFEGLATVFGLDAGGVIGINTAYTRGFDPDTEAPNEIRIFSGGPEIGLSVTLGTVEYYGTVSEPLVPIPFLPWIDVSEPMRIPGGKVGVTICKLLGGCGH